MVRKRGLAVGLGAVLALGMLAACGPDSGSGRFAELRGRLVLVRLRLDIQGASTILPSGAIREESMTLKQITGELVSMDNQFLVVATPEIKGQRSAQRVVIPWNSVVAVEADDSAASK